MAMKIKLYDDETKGFGSIDLEDGKYVFEIVDVEPNPAKTGRPRLQLRLRTVEGPVTDATAFDWWNLPEATDRPDSFVKNFWHDVVRAWPFVYDGKREILDESLLRGQRFRATVTHEEDGTGVMRMRLRSYRFLSNTGNTTAEGASSPATTTVATAAPASVPAPAAGRRPSKFAQP